MERNGGGCEVKQLRWGVDKVERVWDMIIASDVIYVPNVVPLLFDVVTAGLSEVGVFVLAYARRNVKFEMVLEEAENGVLTLKTPGDLRWVVVALLHPLWNDPPYYDRLKDLLVVVGGRHSRRKDTGHLREITEGRGENGVLALRNPWDLRRVVVA